MALEFVALGPHDRERLRAFSCSDYNQWTKRVEHMVQKDLAAELEDPEVTGLGVDDGGELCAVSAWASVASRKDEWELYLLAVAHQRRRQGLARMLMAEIVRRATEQQVTIIGYLVHRANRPMLAFNEELGPVVEPDPDDSDYLACAIRLR